MPHKAPIFRPQGSGSSRTSQRLADRRRSTAASRGYDGRWQRFRKIYLARHPLCVECEKEGVIEPATDVDHIKPVTGPNDPDFYYEDNMQALCCRHHKIKTASKDGGFGNFKR
jgi:5-methylcytosine-specific restriction protein A